MKKAAKVLFVLAICFAAAAIVLEGVLWMLGMSSSGTVIYTMASGFSVAFLGLILLIVGWALDNAKSDSLHRLGIAFHVSGMAILTSAALVLLLVADEPLLTALVIDGGFIDALVLLVALVLYAIAWFLVLLVHAGGFKCHECGGEALKPEEDVHVAAIMKWKKLYNEGIITEREFIDKRNEILGLRK